MPSHKAETIVRVLRDEILSGRRAPGEKLPTYNALIEQFHVTRPTVARVFRALRREGLIESNGTRGIFVATTLPHHTRYFWVTSEQPGSLEWTGFLATILDLIERRETGIDGELIALVGVDGRANNPEYQRLAEAVERGAVAGLFLMNSAAVYLLPALQTPGIPRVAIWAPLPHERAQEYLASKGLTKDRIWALHVHAVGCDRITELLLARKDRPDAIFVTDDNLVRPLLTGFKRAKVRPGKDVYVLAHCNWPRPVGAGEGIEHIGFDVREVLTCAKQCIDEQRAGQPAPGRTVPPRFLSELTRPMSRSRQS